ncbi:WD40/YVTN repeat-like containing protein [Gracilaria domingensis]|nr:WD40/YVTN repeat-like containing protein [Gracilaria domingensis]
MAMAHIPLLITALLTTWVLSDASPLIFTLEADGFDLVIDDFVIPPSSDEFVGGVYAMSNNVTENTIVVYARRPDGTIKLLEPALKTGGKGAVLSLTSPFDPLFSAFPLFITSDKKFVLAVNAGSSSVSVFRVLPDFSLLLVNVRTVAGFGPVSIAVSDDVVYVASIDADGEFDDVFSQKGVLSGFRLLPSGRLVPLAGSGRLLDFRPSAIQFSPDRRSLVVTCLLCSATAIETGGVEEILVFSVDPIGILSPTPVSTATSTELGNTEGRNLPGAIGLEVVVSVSTGVQYVVVPEVRSFAGPDGMDPLDQASSVSTWALDEESKLFPVQLDLPVGSSITSGQMDSCWIEFSNDLSNFWVANSPSNSTSVFSFDAGISTLEEEVGATGAFPTDLWISDDGKFLYQLFVGSVGVFEIGEGGSLTEIQNPMNVPDTDPAGIVAF